MGQVALPVRSTVTRSALELAARQCTALLHPSAWPAEAARAADAGTGQPSSAARDAAAGRDSGRSPSVACHTGIARRPSKAPHLWYPGTGATRGVHRARGQTRQDKWQPEQGKRERVTTSRGTRGREATVQRACQLDPGTRGREATEEQRAGGPRHKRSATVRVLAGMLMHPQGVHKGSPD